jgi:integrase
MGKNLKHQFFYAIEKNFKEGMDKHSMKQNGIRGDGKVYSYSDRKNLIDLASNFANYMRESHQNIKMVKEVKAEHIQEFLNKRSENCSKKTLEQYAEKFKKLELVVNNTYNTKANYKGYEVPAAKEETKIRDSSMSREDFSRLQNHFSNSRSAAKQAIELTEKIGLRVSECTKLQGRDIILQKNIVHVDRSKGGKNRDVPIREKDREYFRELKERTPELERVCPVHSGSINRAIDRAFKTLDLRDKYRDTSIHCIRKMYAQEEYDRCRERGMDIKESLDSVSYLLGHGENRDALVREYVLEIH